MLHGSYEINLKELFTYHSIIQSFHPGDNKSALYNTHLM